MNQTQQIQETSKISKSKQRLLDKANAIATSNNGSRVRRCIANRNIWMVGSGNPKTPNRFYCVTFDNMIDAFVCDCQAYRYNKEGEPCVHIVACAIHEGSHR